MNRLWLHNVHSDDTHALQNGVYHDLFVCVCIHIEADPLLAAVLRQAEIAGQVPERVARSDDDPEPQVIQPFAPRSKLQPVARSDSRERSPRRQRQQQHSDVPLVQPPLPPPVNPPAVSVEAKPPVQQPPVLVSAKAVEAPIAADASPLHPTPQQHAPPPPPPPSPINQQQAHAPPAHAHPIAPPVQTPIQQIPLHQQYPPVRPDMHHHHVQPVMQHTGASFQQPHPQPAPFYPHDITYQHMHTLPPQFAPTPITPQFVHHQPHPHTQPQFVHHQPHPHTQPIMHPQPPPFPPPVHYMHPPAAPHQVDQQQPRRAGAYAANAEPEQRRTRSPEAADDARSSASSRRTHRPPEPAAPPKARSEPAAPQKARPRARPSSSVAASSEAEISEEDTRAEARCNFHSRLTCNHILRYHI